jgi:hypothetical protein
VADAQQRHLTFLARLYRPGADDGGAAEPVPAPGEPDGPPPAFLRFSGQACPAELNVEGLAVPGAALRLPDGGLARWLGAFDLLVLRDLAAEPVAPGRLLERLAAQGLTAGAADALLSWCLRQRVLSACEPR